MGVDFEAEGLLAGLEGDERAARAELLEQLHEAGVPLDELKCAVEEDRLTMLPVERVIAGQCDYTQRELAERTGLELEQIAGLRRALGLPRVEPDERVYTERDVDATKQFKQFIDAGMPYEKVIEVARVMGEAMARIAGSASRAVGESFIQAGDTERDLGLRYAEAARHLGPIMGKQLEYVFTLHLNEQIRSTVIDRAELASGEIRGSEEVVVCFADLVGFTKLGERLPPEEVGKVARRLGDMAGDALEHPVRLVKTIGDAAMLVAPEADPMVDAALRLVEAADGEGEEFPPVHAGIASGRALPRGGDWYGQPVNLASRVTDIARPGAVLATSAVREAAGDSYSWSAAGKRRVKGVKEPVPLFRARRGD